MTCTNCKAKETPLWRRGAHNEVLCNACGLYYRTHGYHRFSKAAGGKKVTKRAPKASSKPISLYATLMQATSGAHLESIIYNGARLRTGDIISVNTPDSYGNMQNHFAYIRALKYQNSQPVFNPVWLFLRSESSWKKSGFIAEDFLVSGHDESFLPVSMISVLLGCSFATTPHIKTQITPKVSSESFREQINRVHGLGPIPFMESKQVPEPEAATNSDDFQTYLLREAVHSALMEVNSISAIHQQNANIMEQVPEINGKRITNTPLIAPPQTPAIPTNELDLSDNFFSMLLSESNNGVPSSIQDPTIDAGALPTFLL